MPENSLSRWSEWEENIVISLWLAKPEGVFSFHQYKIKSNQWNGQKHFAQHQEKE